MTIISFKTDNHTQWEELADLPTPINLSTMHQERKIQWCIDGFFGTSRGREYFNDVREKLSLVLKADVDYSYQTKENYKHTYKLSDFHIEDLRKVVYMKDSVISTGDYAFSLLANYAYALKRTYDEVSYSTLYEYGKSQGIAHNKLKYKVKNIVARVNTFNNIGMRRIKKESVNNRTDNALLQSKKRHEIGFQRYLDYLEGCEMFDPDALKDSSSKMAKELGISWRTIKKYELKVIKNRVVSARNKAMTFIGSIRGYAFNSSLFKLRVNSNIPCMLYSKYISSVINSVYGIIAIDTFNIKDMLWQDHHFQKT